ncbi:hypothetical protein GF314_17650 [bacterium]|nr:hypothetical protein [bacterium]
MYAGWIDVKGWGGTHRGDFEPLVDQATFDRVQAILDGNVSRAVPRQRNNPDFPLRHFVRCANCDTPLTGSHSRGRNRTYAYYHCRSKGCSDQIRVRKEILEEAFVDLLRQLQPRPGLLALFRAIVTDAWQRRYDEAAAHRKTLEKRLEGLQERKSSLIEAHVYKHVISQDDFEREQDKLNAEIALVRIEIHDATLEEYDVEGVLAFADQVLADGARLWAEYDLDQKQRFQQLVFPEGLAFDGTNYRTAPTGGLFTYLQEIDAEKVGVASPTGLEPVLPP